MADGVACGEDTGDIQITIRTPNKIGSRSTDQQTINAYLANELALVKKKLAELQSSSVHGFPRPNIRVRLEDSDSCQHPKDAKDLMDIDKSDKGELSGDDKHEDD